MINKENRKIEDSPQHYALLVYALLKNVSRNHKISSIYIDRHFDIQRKTEKFNKEWERLAKAELLIHHTDSLKDSRINLADFVGGAIFRKFLNKENYYFDLIRDRLSSLNIKDWRGIKSGKN